MASAIRAAIFLAQAGAFVTARRQIRSICGCWKQRDIVRLIPPRGAQGVEKDLVKKRHDCLQEERTSFFSARLHDARRLVSA
jgi:hypothetical protein